MSWLYVWVLEAYLHGLKIYQISYEYIKTSSKFVKKIIRKDLL